MQTYFISTTLQTQKGQNETGLAVTLDENGKNVADLPAARYSVVRHCMRLSM